MISERLHFSRFPIGFQQDSRGVVFQQDSSRSSIGFQGGCISVEARHAFSRSSKGCCITIGIQYFQ